MTQPSPYERIDQLERDVAHLARQNTDLALALAHQSALLAALLGKLGESADSVPGDQPLAPDRQRRVKAN